MRINLFVIDDNELICDALAVAMTSLGYAVGAKTNVDAAIGVMQEWTADVILTDLQLPELADAESVALLRRALPLTPIIAMSGEHSLEAQAYRFGAQAFLSKPCGIQAIDGAISSLLGRARPDLLKPTGWRAR